MTTQRGIQQILEELQSISPHICLKLPASYHSVSRQVERITLAQQQLDHLQRRVSLLAGRSRNLPVHRLYLVLTRAIERMARTAENLKLLAEEYATDPEGSVSCLHCVNQDSRALAETIERVKVVALK